jgi:hypothetical protein
MSLPDFLCIGAQKAGTTWLYEMLRQHPGIWMPPIKEIHYFDGLKEGPDARRKRMERLRDKLPDKIRKAGGALASDKALRQAYIAAIIDGPVGTTEWYSSLFASPDAKDRILGEVTPDYLDIGRRRIATVKETLPQAKLILLVREPVDRALSQIKMRILRDSFDASTEKTFVAEFDRFINGGAFRGNYKAQIPLWQSFYAAEALLILPFGQVKSDPKALIERVESFLGLPNFAGYQALDEAAHVTKPVTIPDWVRERLGTHLAAEVDYLKSAFGEAFYDATR